MLRKRAVRKAVPVAPSAAETATLDLLRQWAADGSLDLTDIARTLSLPVFRALIERGEAALGGDGGLAKGPHSAFGPQEGGKFLEWLKDTTDTLRGSWWQRAENPVFTKVGPEQQTFRHSGTLLPDGRVVLAPVTSTSVVIFDPSSDSFSEIDVDAPGNWAYYGSVLLPDGRVFFAGFGTNFASPAIFNPADNTLTDVEITFPSSWDATYVNINTCSLLSNGRVFIGYYDRYTDDIIAYIYDPITGDTSFPSLPFLPGDSFNGANVLLPDGRLLLTSFYGKTDSIFIIVDILANAITRIPVTGWFFMDIASMVLLPNGEVFCLSYGNTGTMADYSVYEYVFFLFDPSSSQISEILMTTEEQSHFWSSAMLLSDGRVLLFGDGVDAKVYEVYDPKTGSRTNIEHYSILEQIYNGSILRDGRVLCVGSHTHILSGFPRPPLEFCLHPCFNKAHNYA